MEVEYKPQEAHHLKVTRIKAGHSTVEDHTVEPSGVNLDALPGAQDARIRANELFQRLKEMGQELRDLRQQAEEAKVFAGRVIAGLEDGDPQAAMQVARDLRARCEFQEIAVNEIKKERARYGAESGRFKYVQAQVAR